MAVIRHPACGEAIHRRNHLVERDPAVAPGDLPQSVFGTLQAFRRDAETAVGVQAVAEELSFPNRGGGAFLPMGLSGSRACRGVGGGANCSMSRISYRGYRFPSDIIQRAVWLYFRFILSFR